MKISDRDFIDLAAKGLRIEAEPLRPLADSLGIGIEDAITTLRRLIEEKKVRRFAASVRHQPMGYAFNAMVIARVEEDLIEKVGGEARAIDSVSHCYQREHPDGDPWCVYIMIHGQEHETVKRAIQRIRELPGVRGLEICRSLGELKKTSLSGVTTNLDDYDDGD